MEAQDQQPIGPRVFWTIGFLGLGTLSAIGAHALFPWALAIIIAIVVVGMASACSFQFRETRNYLYLASMLAMTCLASFLDGVSVWEILNHRQNTQLRGIQAVRGITDDQFKAAEKDVQTLREEIASLTEEAQNMDNDGNKANDKLIAGVLAKIESKKADLPNLEAKAEALRTKVVDAASTAGVTDASRHFFLQIADRHENPALWLITWASIAFLVPELTLALLAWSLKGNKRQQMRPQPVVIVSQQGFEHASQQPQIWHATPAAAPALAMAQPGGGYAQQAVYREPVALAAPPQPSHGPLYAPPQPVPAGFPMAPAPALHGASPQLSPAMECRPERTTIFSEPEAEPMSSAPRMGVGQWMAAATETQAASAPVSEPASQPLNHQAPAAAPASEPRLDIPSCPAPVATPRPSEAEPEVMLSSHSVPEQEDEPRQPARHGVPAAAHVNPEPGAGRAGFPHASRQEGGPDRAKGPGQPSSSLEAVRNGMRSPHKETPTEKARMAAKREKQKGEKRPESLSRLASRGMN